MKIKNRLSHGIISLKLEFIPTLSFEAQGVLSQMVNLPNCDHVTVKKFHKQFPEGRILELKKVFEELERKNYIFKDSSGAYVVNKISLVKKMHWIDPSDRKEWINAGN